MDVRLTVGAGSSCRSGLDLRWRSTYRGVVVAPSQLLFTLALRLVGEAGRVARTIPDEEGASPGGDEGGIFCGGGGGSIKDWTAADAGVRVIILLG